jgi:hypothetical protein
MTLPLLAIALALQSSAAPQAPIAAGSFDSIVDVLRAAKGCGVRGLRLEMYPTALLGDTRLYLIDSPNTEEINCLEAWLAANAKRLHLARP